MDKTILGISIQPRTKKEIIEVIKNNLTGTADFIHIVSLNPELVVIAHRNSKVKEAVEEAQIKIIDGVGIILAGKILGVPVGERLTGVDLMKEIIHLSRNLPLRILIIGGRPNLASKFAKTIQPQYPNSQFLGLTGIKNKNNPRINEERKIFSLISEFRPQVLFLALGAPYQELWIHRYRKKLKGIVCLGIGGAVDFLSGAVARAPKIIRLTGLEWLFRLITQPWRWKRQLRLISFLGLVIREKLNKFQRFS